MSVEIRAAKNWATITPSDTANIAIGTIKAIYVGGTGDINAVKRGDETAVVIPNVQAGTYLLIDPLRINSTSTTATDLVALYD